MKRASAADIGAIDDEVSCAWCGYTQLSSPYKLGNGDHLCVDCCGLAREVGEGFMDVTSVVESPGASDYPLSGHQAAPRYTFDPPLRLGLCVEYDGQGRYWLRGEAADGAVATILGLRNGPADEDAYDILWGTDRADLCANLAGCLTRSLEYWQERVSEAAHADDDPARAVRARASAEEARAALAWFAQHVRIDQ